MARTGHCSSAGQPKTAHPSSTVSTRCSSVSHTSPNEPVPAEKHRQTRATSKIVALTRASQPPDAPPVDVDAVVPPAKKLTPAQKHACTITLNKQNATTQALEPLDGLVSSEDAMDINDNTSPQSLQAQDTFSTMPTGIPIAPVSAKRKQCSAPDPALPMPDGSTPTGAANVQGTTKRSRPASKKAAPVTSVAPPALTATPNTSNSSLPSLLSIVSTPGPDYPPGVTLALHINPLVAPTASQPATASCPSQLEPVSTSAKAGKKKKKSAAILSDLLAERAANAKLITKLQEKLTQKEEQYNILEKEKTQLQKDADPHRLKPRPAGRRSTDWNLQVEMGLANNKAKYNAIMTSVRDCLYKAGFDVWKKLDQQEVGRMKAAADAAKAVPGNEILSTFEGDWVIREFFKQTIREKRKLMKSHARKIAEAESAMNTPTTAQ
ncbi:hypothetical protein FRB99_001984, partial [Tulasnella sp. 403]